MIDGFRIDVPADELARHLDERIRHHHDRGAECESRARRFDDLDSSTGDDEDGDQLIGCLPGVAHDLERRAARHRQREALLMFLRNHIVTHEIYRLSEADLKSLELLPIELRTL